MKAADKASDFHILDVSKYVPVLADILNKLFYWNILDISMYYMCFADFIKVFYDSTLDVLNVILFISIF